MTRDDTVRIESALGIALAEQYRRAVAADPIPALRGSTEWMFWDDSDELIALNKRMRERERFHFPWPSRFFALGEDGGGYSDAIDLEDPECGVFLFDRQHINVSYTDRSDEKIDARIKRQVSDSRHDLEAHGIDPLGAGEETWAIQEESGKGGCVPSDCRHRWWCYRLSGYHRLETANGELARRRSQHLPRREFNLPCPFNT